MKALLISALALAITGCASSHVLVGQARAPIDPEQVQLYLDPPPGYETVALLESSNRGAINFTDQQRTNTVIGRMKEEAAALGANGILIKGMGKEYAGSVGSGNAWASGGSAYGVGFSAPVFNKVGSGIAIFVANPVVGAAAVAPAALVATAAVAAAEVAQPTAVNPTVPTSMVAPEPPAAAVPYERDPSKRCDACARMTRP